MRVDYKLFTPKAFDSEAQGQRRSRATLGGRWKKTLTPKALHSYTAVLCNAFGVKGDSDLPHPACASRRWAVEYNRFAVKASWRNRVVGFGHWDFGIGFGFRDSDFGFPPLVPATGRSVFLSLFPFSNIYGSRLLGFINSGCSGERGRPDSK